MLVFQEVLLPPDGFVNDVKVIRTCIIQLQDHVFNQLNKIVSEELLKSVSLLRESVLGTVTRCLETLENSSDHESYAASQAFKSILDSAYHLDVSLMRPVIIYGFNTVEPVYTTNEGTGQSGLCTGWI